MRKRTSLQFGAVVALLLYTVLVIIFVHFVLHNVLFSILLGLTIVGTLYGAWQLFSGTGRRLRSGALFVGVGLIALTFEILYFFIKITNAGALLVVFALAASYVVLLNFLRAKFWEERRRTGRQAQKFTTFNKPYLIINPKSGNGRAIKARIDKLASERGIEVYVTKKGDNFESLVRKAAKRGADILGVSGGDGTIGAVAKVAIEYNLPLVVLPGGTRCHFARDIGLDPSRIVDALEGFNGIERKIDVGKINDRIFLNNASFGIYADIVDHDEYRDHKVATTRKVLQELLSGQRDMYSLRFKDTAGHFHSKAVQLFIGVNPYQVMNLLELGHREKLDTGKLQITALTKLDDATLRSLMGTYTFKRNLKTGSNVNIMQWAAQDLTIRSSSKQLAAGVDGERETYKTPVKISILPLALTLMVPPEGVRPRRKSPFSQTVIGQLWRTAFNK